MHTDGVSAASVAAGDGGAQERRSQVWWIFGLGLLTFVSRLLYTSAPYFVDGPRHVVFIERGMIFVPSPPGYFLFGEVAGTIARLLHLSVPVAILALNIVFSTLGAMVFAQLARRVFPGSLGVLLAFCYAFSDTVWFVADIHSTYAAMTFFAPVLMYGLWFEWPGWVLGVVWALMAGFRPSDGVFVLPFVIFMMRGKGLRQMALFVVAAVPVAALWYVPTVRHFGGDLLSPLRVSGSQVNTLANGLLAHVAWKNKAGNLIHIAFGCFNAWSILTLFVITGCFVRSALTRSMLIFVAPGLLFYVLFFFSDATYFAFMVAAGLLLAGEGLRSFAPKKGVLIAGCALVISVGQMTMARPMGGESYVGTVMNAYCLKYSGWGIRHRFAPRLRDTLKTLHAGAD